MTEEGSGPALDQVAIRQLLEITGGDPEFLDELLQAFLDGARDQLADMERATAEGSAEAMMRPAHSLKANAANIGAHRLVELARALEADARAGSVDDAASRVASIAAELEVVKAELATIRQRS
jgi:HPt (histidine-containing phosphotransfer) domain-containing protein